MVHCNSSLDTWYPRTFWHVRRMGVAIHLMQTAICMCVKRACVSNHSHLWILPSEHLAIAILFYLLLLHIVLLFYIISYYT